MPARYAARCCDGSDGGVRREPSRRLGGWSHASSTEGKLGVDTLWHRSEMHSDNKGNREVSAKQTQKLTGVFRAIETQWLPFVAFFSSLGKGPCERSQLKLPWGPPPVVGSASALCRIHTASSLARKRELILDLFSTLQNQVKHLSVLSQAIDVLDVLWEAAAIFLFLPSAAVWMLVSLLYVGGDQYAALQNPCASHLYFSWTLRCNPVGHECFHFPGCQAIIRPLLAVKVIQLPMVRPIEDQEGHPLNPKVLSPGLLFLGSWISAALFLLCETIYGFTDCIQPRVTGLGQSLLAPCPLPEGT